MDILKEKIRKAWGAIMEKEADAFLKATEVHWEAAFKATAASRELRESMNPCPAQKAGQGFVVQVQDTQLFPVVF